jgi:DNA-binding NtrC family response regulator
MQRSIEILVIEDEPSVGDALRLILEGHGYAVAVALTGRDGIERDRQGNFELIITDLRLPDMDGLEIIDAIQRHDPLRRFILITSYGTPETFAEAHRRGAAGTLSKPFLPSEIIRLVRTTLDGHAPRGL